MAPTGGPLPGWGPPPPPPRPGQAGAIGRPVARFGTGALVAVALAGVVVGVVLAFLGLFVASAVYGRSAPHPAVAAYGPLPESASSPEVGDCLSTRPALTDVSSDDDVVPCKELHRAEVIGIVALPALERRPRDRDVDLYTSEACALAYRDRVGADPEGQGAFDFGAVVPDRKAWDAGDRQVWCILDPLSSGGDGLGPVVGTDG